MTFTVELQAVLNKLHGVYTRIHITDVSSPIEAASEAMRIMGDFDNGISPGFGWDWWQLDEDDVVDLCEGSTLEISKRVRVIHTTEVIINLP